MRIEIALIVLLAAFLHAGWNALAKSAPDGLLVLGSVALMEAIAGAVLIPYVPAPAPQSWPLIGLSTIFHYAYFLLLFNAYRFGDLSQVYPIARGLAPVLVALGATLFGGEMLSPLSMAGVLFSSLGISSLAFLQGSLWRKDLPSVMLAVATGAMIAAYTVADGIGVRLSESTFGFMAWLFFLELPVAIFVIYLRRGRFLAPAKLQWNHCLGAGISSVFAYGLVIYALAIAPMAAVSALRETSVVMAALIGAVLLGERPWKQRVVASIIVAGGVALITIQS